jgi:hypothetical protein
MLTNRLLSAGFHVELNSATHECDWHSIVIKTAVMICIRRDVGSHVRLA